MPEISRKIERSIPVGRGWAFPFEFENGGVKPNMPASPSSRQVIDGILMGAHFLLTWTRGSAFMARNGGSSAALLLMENANNATADQIATEGLTLLSEGIPHASVTDVRAVLRREDIDIEITLRPKYSLSAITTSLSIPLKSVGV